MAQETPVQFRPGQEVKKWITEQAEIRGKKEQSAGLAALDSLILFKALLAAELARQTWSPRQLDILNAATRAIRPDTIAVPNGTGQCWGAVRAHCDQTDPVVADLLARLEELGPTADKALLHAVTAHRDQDLPDTAEGWAQVGITTE
ncbi:hypothetical protein [Acidipropionibacterium jensenii]|uniref:hypothetical protein n=1 Tax=Acidipropionibacterium jensenii TaxID=1749 RepID=UPI002649BEA4|nr:hypothetical protein [Acidipropionibacterium jensenii]MDN5997324.1 hypothetical protein [Acidipropionibacterium jensenii]MDN6428181.1 hypothetical protein [Acidipropionibacterium jensenii]MDN6793030.1 hypothetical protein [Acidipropionibacterium jensenii]MDN6812691.1 hypothetical protein [Acidipropionibacterium jensenii]